MSENRPTKRLVLLVVFSVIIILIVVISAPQSSKDRAPARGGGGGGESALPTLHETPREVPAITFADGEGEEATLATFKGQVGVVNFWATWCAPCIRELPSLMRLAATMKDYNLALIALSQDSQGAGTVAPFLEKNRLSGLPVFYDPKGAAARALHVSSLPTTLLIDAKGREVWRFEGAYEWDQPHILGLLQELTESAPQKAYSGRRNNSGREAQ